MEGKKGVTIAVPRRAKEKQEKRPRRRAKTVKEKEEKDLTWGWRFQPERGTASALFKVLKDTKIAPPGKEEKKRPKGAIPTHSKKTLLWAKGGPRDGKRGRRGCVRGAGRGKKVGGGRQ